MGSKNFKLKPEFKEVHKWDESELDTFRLGMNAFAIILQTRLKEMSKAFKNDEDMKDDIKLVKRYADALIKDSIIQMNKKPYDEINILYDNHVKVQLINAFPDEVLQK